MRRASQPALQRQGSIVEEVDMVDCQVEEEEEEEMMLRRRCLSLTQLETRSISSANSLPSSPLGTPLKSRLLGTPSKNSPRGTPKKTTATPARRPILTPVRSNPTLLTPVRNQIREKPSWEEEAGRDQEGNVSVLQKEDSQEHLEDQTILPQSAQLSRHGEEALDLRVGFGAKDDLSGGVFLELGEETDVHLHQSDQQMPLFLDQREPDPETAGSLSSRQWMESGMVCSSTGSPRKALVVAGDPQSPITTSFGWVEGSLEGESMLMKGELRVGSLLTEKGEMPLKVTEKEEVVVVEQISR